MRIQGKTLTNHSNIVYIYNTHIHTYYTYIHTSNTSYLEAGDGLGSTRLPHRLHREPHPHRGRDRVQVSVHCCQIPSVYSVYIYDIAVHILT